MCGLADDTNRGYLQELRKFASARTSLDDQVLHLVQTTQSESSLKKLLSGLRLLEKLRWIPPTVSAGDWLVVQAMEKYQEKLGKVSSKSWASMRGFANMCKLARSPADWELCAMAALSISFGLRAIEALSVSYDGGSVRYAGAKGRQGLHSEEAGPWARDWGEFLQMLRARHGFPPARSAWFTSRAALHRGIAELVGCAEEGNVISCGLLLPELLVRVRLGMAVEATRSHCGDHGTVHQFRSSVCSLGGANSSEVYSWGPGCTAPCAALHTRAICEILCPTMGRSASLTTPRWGTL